MNYIIFLFFNQHLLNLLWITRVLWMLFYFWNIHENVLDIIVGEINDYFKYNFNSFNGDFCHVMIFIILAIFIF